MGLFYLTAHHVKPGLEKNGTFRSPRREKKKKKKKEKTKNTPEYFSVITEKLDCVLPEVKLIFRRIFGGLHSMFSG